MADSSTFAPAGIPARSRFFVYVQPGETIALGSSANGIGQGRINYRAPGQTAFTTCPITGTIGRIQNRMQELAGPAPAAGGYDPCIVTVGPALGGLWEVEFVSPLPTGSGNPPGLANVAWNPQTTSQPYVTAWDITVRTGGVSQTGRVFTNLLTVTHNAGDVRSQVFVQTSDGYRYSWGLNGVTPGQASLVANAQGFTAAGVPLLRSVQLVGANPGTLPAGTQIGNLPASPGYAGFQAGLHKILLNPPSPILPAQATSPYGTTWLRVTPAPLPTAAVVQFVGKEGTPGSGGTAPLAGVFQAQITGPGALTLALDLDQNGNFNDPADRLLSATATAAGTVALPWDGLNGLGNPVGAVTLSLPVQTTVVAGEMHFPAIDFEGNVSGFIVQRRNPTTNAVEDDTIFFDDRALPSGGSAQCTADATNGRIRRFRSQEFRARPEPTVGRVTTATAVVWTHGAIFASPRQRAHPDHAPSSRP